MALPLLLAPIVSMLADKGLGLLSNAIEGGADKAIEFVTEKTGMDLTQKTSLSSEDIAVLKQLEADHKSELMAYHLANTRDARNMNVKVQESENASWLAKNTAYILDFMIVGSTILLGVALFFKSIPEANQEIAYMLFGSLLTLCGTSINFHRGSAQGSKDKAQHLMKKG